MAKIISEKSLEDSIESALLDSGYMQRKPENYDRYRCLIPEDVFGFIYRTQPNAWEQLKQHYGDQIQEKFLNLLAKDIEKWGTLHVLRKGIKDCGCHFDLAYFKPVSGLNEETIDKYKQNIFSVIRQLKYSEKNENSLDVALFLNGIPLFTAELKNVFTGQDYTNAITQYRNDRDPNEPLFKFGRCLAHFAIDPDEVWMTTTLKGKKTHFLPFNKGFNNGRGNKPSLEGYSTAYLWEEIWQPDSVLNLIQQFVHMVDKYDKKGRKTGEKQLIFPRYHQLDCVRRLIADAKTKGTGQHYLIQHSAGSGKSNSIAWLAHQLSSLHDANDHPIFDSVIIITDRRILDKQLQRNVKQFQQVLGTVENIDKTSRQLKDALADGKKIIVSTLQKFGVIVDTISQLNGNRFALIIDEAHSSQSGGTSSDNVSKVLAVNTLEEAEEIDNADVETTEDRILEELNKKGQLPNVSYFAFTATPKDKTLELFGTKRPDGKFEAFSLYSMKQAIDEGFIKDVLQNYTSYATYWRLLKTVEDDPKFEKTKAKSLLKSFVEHHPHNIDKKVAIIVEHFVDHSMYRIGGKAKAMIVTRSRKHAVRYKLAMDKYLKSHGYVIKALVAFSGEVEDEGNKYTESGMNSLGENEPISDTQTAEAFEKDEFRFLIVANKFQTGFDQPLLHTMYVDKPLGGLQAVQTLSRLNRTYPGKEETMVLDFANDPQIIQEAFQQYYEVTLLSEATDPHQLYELQTKLEDFGFYSPQEIDKFADVYWSRKPKQEKLYAAVQPAVDRWKAAEKDEQIEFRGSLKNYCRLYAFLSQIVQFKDPDLEKLYQYGKLLYRRLPVGKDELPVEVINAVDLDSISQRYMGTQNVKLEPGVVEIDPASYLDQHILPGSEKEPLSKIIEELNERFGVGLERHKVVISQMFDTLLENDNLRETVKINPKEDAKLSFNLAADDTLNDIMQSNLEFYKLLDKNKSLEKALLDWMFEQLYKKAHTEKVSNDGKE